MTWLLIIFGSNGHAASTAEFAREELCRQAVVQVQEIRTSGNYRYSAICVKRSGL